MRLVPEGEIRGRVAVVFERQRTALAALLPGARIEHIGSTAVPGSLTKGDLDICAIVATADFEGAAETLAKRYRVHQPENWTAEFGSFVAQPEDGVAVGVQIVVGGSVEEEWFIGWRERLRSDPELRALRPGEAGARGWIDR